MLYRDSRDVVTLQRICTSLTKGKLKKMQRQAATQSEKLRQAKLRDTAGKRP